MEQVGEKSNVRIFLVARASSPLISPTTPGRDGLASANEVTMKSTSESLSRPETSHGRAAGGNRVAARRGGEQPEADPWSRTQVNPIRSATTASLPANGEACRQSGDCLPPHPSLKGEKQVVGDGWGGNAGKVSWWTVESCPGRKPRERLRAAVRAAIVVRKRGNARGAKGGRERNHKGKQAPSPKRQRLPMWLERRGHTRPWGSTNPLVVCRAKPGPGGNPEASRRTSAPVSGASPVRDEPVNPQLESRVREIRTHGSEGGAGQSNAPSLSLSAAEGWARGYRRRPKMWGTGFRTAPGRGPTGYWPPAACCSC